MLQNKVKILVACHKPDTVYQDDVYTPIHVGRAISKFKNEMSDMIGDDTGDNISIKNPHYCELTAQYWAWKNLTNVEYVGLAHYRRYFETKLTRDNVDMLLGDNYDVIACRPLVCRKCIGIRLSYFTCCEDVSIFNDCIKKISPQYYYDAHSVLNGNVIMPYNMLVMKKSEYDKFCEWQFNVFAEMEKYVKYGGYFRLRRVLGYLAEVMLTIYVKYNHLKVRYEPVVSMLGDNAAKDSLSIIKNLYNTFVYKVLRESCDDTILYGRNTLAIEGIKVLE